MSWGAIAVIGGGALLGGVNANDQQQAQTKQNKAAAEHNRYSNWTGRTMQQRFDAPSAFGGALSGGMAGFGAAQGAGAGMFGKAEAAPTLFGSGAEGALSSAPAGQSASSFWGGENPYASKSPFSSMLAKK